MSEKLPFRGCIFFARSLSVFVSQSAGNRKKRGYSQFSVVVVVVIIIVVVVVVVLQCKYLSY